MSEPPEWSLKQRLSGDSSALSNPNIGVAPCRSQPADHRLGLTEALAAELRDPRRQHLVRYTMAELLREQIDSMMLGHRAQDDVDRLGHDPALRISTWDRRGEGPRIA